MSIFVIKMIPITKAIGSFAGKKAWPIRGHGILDGTNFNAFDVNELVSIVIFRIKNPVGSPDANFYGTKPCISIVLK